MRISKKAEYALRALVAIAQVGRSRPVPIQELARGDAEFPVKFLEQILLALKNGGLLESKRGVGGGYRLTRPASQISLADVLYLIDGPFAPLGDSTPLATGLTRCFADLREQVDAFLKGRSIQDVVDLGNAGEALAFEI